MNTPPAHPDTHYHPRPRGTEPCVTTFRSAKNNALLTGTTQQMSLFFLLETEPGVQGYEPLEDGSVEVRNWHGICLCAVLPSRGVGRENALRLKRDAARRGRRLVLMPEKRLGRWPQRDCREIVAEAGHADLTASERVRIMEALLEAGGSAPLGDLARLVRSDDPIASILSLVSRCVVSVDMSKPLNAETQVSVFDPLTI
jgi:hypothetical protein